MFMSDFDETEILFELVKNKFGKSLDEEQLEKVKEKISEITSTIYKIRLIPLKNSDEPKFIFTPLTEDEA